MLSSSAAAVKGKPLSLELEIVPRTVLTEGSTQSLLADNNNDDIPSCQTIIDSAYYLTFDEFATAAQLKSPASRSEEHVWVFDSRPFSGLTAWNIQDILKLTESVRCSTKLVFGKGVLLPSHVQTICEALAQKPLVQVRSFQLKFAQLSLVGAKAILASFGSDAFKTTERLEISNCDLKSGSLSYLAQQLDKLKALRELSLSSNMFGDDGLFYLVTALQSASCSSRLEVLNLGENAITDMGFAHLNDRLLSKGKLPKLRSLTLKLNQLSDQSARMMGSALRKLHFLQELDLDANTWITEQSVKGLVKVAKGHRALVRIRCSGQHDAQTLNEELDRVLAINMSPRAKLMTILLVTVPAVQRSVSSSPPMRKSSSLLRLLPVDLFRLLSEMLFHGDDGTPG